MKTRALEAVCTLLAVAMLVCIALPLPARGYTPGKRIVISIDDQVIYFLEDDILVKSHLCSTGKDETPTPLGVFHVREHAESNKCGSVMLYDLLYFHQNLAMHGLLYDPATGNWLGGDTLGQKASHGCVRQANADAEWAYSWTPDGTRLDVIQEHFVPPPPPPPPAPPISGGHDTIGSLYAYRSWYFPEGCVSEGFEEYVLVSNPGPMPARVTATLSVEQPVKVHTFTVGAFSRQTLDVNSLAGTDTPEISVTLSSDQPIVAERTMYFDAYEGGCQGGHNTMGAPFTSSTFYFAEGTCRPGFDPYICVFNPGYRQADVKITYMLGDGNTRVQYVEAGGQSRTTVSTKQFLGEGDGPSYDFSCKVECLGPDGIVVERPVYFNYNGCWSGGHNVIGALAPARAFYFAEGTCRPDFDPYICVFNPGYDDAQLKIAFMKGDGTNYDLYLDARARSRTTVPVKDFLGEGDSPSYDFSFKLESSAPVVVERPMYFGITRD